jgi:hypothetical protein
MLSKKYVGDYRLENVKDKNGKLVTRPVYKGAWYVFVNGADNVRQETRLIAVLTAAAIVFLAVSLLFYSNKGFTAQYYTLIPFLVCVFPLMYLCIAVYNLIKVTRRDPVRATREENDKMSDRVAKCTFVMMLLSGWNLCGIVLAYILKLAGKETRPVVTGDIVFSLSSALFFAVIVFIFSRRKKTAMRPEITAA